MPGAKSLHTDEPDTSPLSSISAWNDSVAELKRQATKTIYVHSRVIYVGHVDLTSQTFFCRFDLFVAWDPKECGTTETFDPFLRMPQSESWSELFRFPLETPAGRVGFRATYEGVFICALELESFPFDAQAFDIRIQMGKDKVSGAILSLTNGYKLEHNPNFPNMIASQISDEYEFRPLRYSLSVTSRLESPEPRCEYMISIPASRKSGYYLSNHYFFVLLMFFFSFTFFVLPVDDIANRIMNNMTIFLINVAFKFSVSATLPKIGYQTAFDKYLAFSFVYLLLDPAIWSIIYVLENSSAADIGPAEVARLWVKNNWMAIGKVGLMFAGHAKLYYDYLVDHGKRSSTFAQMGKMDDALVKILTEQGIRFKPDGTVGNMVQYLQLIDS
ncbi:hypothetical protein KFE25_011022 [Diacronema lutheri]|uniref:Neurotransmitter-gated ion-channel ligand-binding domain-containing protein n=2 Tax=Diacronema lutheri TaxID=2081491 RepID=A0A8J5XAP5_DIALT|nr:hypothetical protein KFE25_011022 [Diacronema lutheri]